MSKSIEILVQGSSGSGKLQLASYINYHLKQKKINSEFVEHEGIVREETLDIDNLSTFFNNNGIDVKVKIDGI